MDGHCGDAGRSAACPVFCNMAALNLIIKKYRSLTNIMNAGNHITTIALVGPQSTGKSTLARQLAEKYGTAWVPEFARQYHTESSKRFTYAQVAPLAKGQIASEQKERQLAHRFLFCDTDALTTLIWSDIYFKKYPSWLLRHVLKRPPDLYLLLDKDLAFEADAQREQQEMQAIFLEKFYYYLEKFNLPYRLVTGHGDVRLLNASLLCEAAFIPYRHFTLFEEPSSPFSQWHPSRFRVGDVGYCCAEQFMMHQKALLFHDAGMAGKIMQTERPDEHQALGRLVRNFDRAVWRRHCKAIVYTGNRAKFSQDAGLWQLLNDTQGTLLVEAYEHCNYWSAGMNAHNPRILEPALWKGENWVGLILTKVRDDLREKGRAAGSPCLTYSI